MSKNCNIKILKLLLTLLFGCFYCKLRVSKNIFFWKRSFHGPEFRFHLQQSLNIVIVEMITPETTKDDIALTDSHICPAYNISPMRLIYFIEEIGERQLIQFAEF